MKEFTKDNITTEDIQSYLYDNGLYLDWLWNGQNPVLALRPNTLNPWTIKKVNVDLELIINYLNLKSGFFDPIKLGM